MKELPVREILMDIADGGSSDAPVFAYLKMRLADIVELIDFADKASVSIDHMKEPRRKCEIVWCNPAVFPSFHMAGPMDTWHDEDNGCDPFERAASPLIRGEELHDAEFDWGTLPQHSESRPTSVCMFTDGDAVWWRALYDVHGEGETFVDTDRLWLDLLKKFREELEAEEPHRYTCPQGCKGGRFRQARLEEITDEVDADGDTVVANIRRLNEVREWFDVVCAECGSVAIDNEEEG